MSIAVTTSPAARPAAQGLARALNLGLVGLMLAIVLAGFWPYFSALPFGTGAHWILHLHAAVFVGWMLLYLAQVWLVYRRKVRTHQALGRFGIYYGVLVLLFGVVVTFAVPVLNVQTGRMTFDEAAGFLVLPIGDLILFGGFFWAGIRWRRRRELHTRLMLLATIAVLFPPAARFGIEYGVPVALLVWLSPLFLAMAHDALTARRVDRTYVIGLAILLAGVSRVALMESELWLPTGRAIIQFFTGPAT
jgi:hypothetical protein